MGPLRSEAVNKTNEELAEIQNLPVPELSDRLEGLSLFDLAALRALEVAGSDRKTALEAIDAQVAKLEADALRDPNPSTTVQTETVSAPADDAPAWQAEDYTGALNIEQAEWRNANLKPVAVTTKPVKAPKTK